MNSQQEKALIEQITRAVMATLGKGTGGVKKIHVPELTVTEEHRMNTGNPRDRVWTRDLFTLEESPKIGCGLTDQSNLTPFTAGFFVVVSVWVLGRTTFRNRIGSNPTLKITILQPCWGYSTSTMPLSLVMPPILLLLITWHFPSSRRYSMPGPI